MVITEPRVNISQSVPPLFDRNGADVVDSAELFAPCHVLSPPGNTGSNPLLVPSVSDVIGVKGPRMMGKC